MKEKKENDRGELMLEALIVYPITMFLLFFILALFSLLFQRWNIQTIANESAARMAQTYRLSTADESTGYVSKEDLVDIGAYRYVFNKDKMKTDIRNRVSQYASWRLTNTTYTKNVTEPVCKVDVIHDSLGRRHIEVVISGEYSVPFGAALSYFGFPGTTTYEVTAYADCVDLVDYIQTINYVDKTVKLDKSIFGLFDAILSLGNTVGTALLSSEDGGLDVPGSNVGGFR